MALRMGRAAVSASRHHRVVRVMRPPPHHQDHPAPPRSNREIVISARPGRHRPTGPRDRPVPPGGPRVPHCHIQRRAQPGSRPAPPGRLERPADGLPITTSSSLPGSTARHYATPRSTWSMPGHGSTGRCTANTSPMRRSTSSRTPKTAWTPDSSSTWEIARSLPCPSGTRTHRSTGGKPHGCSCSMPVPTTTPSRRRCRRKSPAGCSRASNTPHTRGEHTRVLHHPESAQAARHCVGRPGPHFGAQAPCVPSPVGGTLRR
jgi:hypothetical protein